MVAKSDGRELDSRARDILKLIIRSYVNSGEPVGSRTLAKSMDWKFSPATIRNVMADLDEEGYLAQPHTSAGRIPTEKAFRVYVQSLTMRRMASQELERLRAEFGRLETVEARVEHTRSEEHTSELQSPYLISYAVFCLKK